MFALERPVLSCFNRSQAVPARSLLDLTLDEFIEQCDDVSTRLYNVLRFAASENNLPYASVRAYLQAGPERVEHLLKLPALGRKSANEFDRLVMEAAVAQRFEPDQHEQQKRPAGHNSHSSLPENFNVSLVDFLARQPSVSARLWRIIKAAVDDCSCPYATVTDYLQDGARRVDTLCELPGLGSTSAHEFEDLVQATLWRKNAEPSSTIPENFNVSLLEFLARQPAVSPRLWRVIQTAIEDGRCPYPSLAEYIRAGAKRIETLRGLPSLGSQSASEFEDLVQAAVRRGTIESSPTVTLNANGFPELEGFMGTLLDSLDQRVLNLLLDRVRPGGTLESVAQDMGLTRERVRQIEVKAVKRLGIKFGRDFVGAFAAIEQHCRQHGIRECTIHELAALAGCDVMTCDLYFRFLEKLKINVPPTLMLCENLHLIRPAEFASRDTWNERIEKALLNAQWPLVLQAFFTLVDDVPRHYVQQRLTEHYHAQIVDGAFSVQPRLSKPKMCLQVLAQAGKPLHLSEIRAGLFKHFEIDLNLHYVISIVGSHDEITICGPGTYVRYADVPYSSALIQQVRDNVHAELMERQVFLSAKVLFDRLFAADAANYPDGFNHYFVLGFCQDDPRFVCKRGNMVGLVEFDVATAYVSLEDEVRDIVLEHGPIDTAGILDQLSDTRKLCNDTGVRLILANSPEVIRVGRRTYDSLHRFFARREEYDELVLALKISLLESAKSVYALNSEMAALGLRKASSEVIASILSADDDVNLRNGMYRLTPTDSILQHYEQLARACLSEGGFERLSRLAGEAFGVETSQRLIGYDQRFSHTSKLAGVDDTGSELQSLLADFDF